MILTADREGIDQTVNAQGFLGLSCPQMPVWTFSLDAAEIIITKSNQRYLCLTELVNNSDVSV